MCDKAYSWDGSSSSCVYAISQASKFAFDTVTGVGALDGHQLLTLDPAVGVLLVAPSKHLKFEPGPGRSTIALQCKVYGHYQENPRYESRFAASDPIHIEISDDMCWTPRNANFVERMIQKDKNGNDVDQGSPFQRICGGIV